MLVGESVYNWGEGFDARYQQTGGLRETHRRHALNYRRDSPYVRNIERAIYRASEPSEDQKTCTFQYLKGWQEYFDLSHLMAIDQAIVYGLEAKKVDALVEVLKLRGASFKQDRLQAKVGRTRPRLITTSDHGRALKLLFIRHPSAFFSWRKWAPVIREHLPSQFDVADTTPAVTA